MKKILLLALLLFSIQSLFAQSYGNEWINFNQDYYKLKIGREGIYRISHTALKAKGFPVASINPKNIQIWVNGKELPILVNNEADNTFDSLDYIEFYGIFNNGVLDADLYPNPAEQPHQYMSLYSDTSIYFLTVGSSPGKRITVINDNNYTGKIADPYFFYEQVIWFNNRNKGQFYDGHGFATEGFHSEYTEGEGWGLQFDGAGQKLTFLTPQLTASGARPYLEVLAHSRANNTSSYDIDGFNNGMLITFDPSNTAINSKRVRGYGRYFFQDSINRALVGKTSTVFKFASNILAKSIHSLAYVKLVYPRLFHLNDSSRFKLNYNSTNTFIRFAKYPTGRTKPIVYDYLNHVKAIAEIKTGELYCNLSGANTNRSLFILDETQVFNIPIANIRPYKFVELKPISGQDYLIISHQKLDSGAKAYRDFLATNAGGNHQAYIANTDQITDQFYYGLKHPMALKNFCRYSINTVNSFKYLLLLGKGQKYSNSRFNNLVNVDFDLVPTYGVPPTDYFFVTGYNGSNLEPLMAVGRVPATNNNQIANYLSKLNDRYLGGYQSWQKNVLQLAGGLNPSEVSQFVSYQNTFFNLIKNPIWGANRKLISKSDPSPIDSSLKTKIQKEINLGYSLVDYFGHGSTQASDIDLGDAYQLNNFNKYPFFYFNGCGLGNTFDGGSLAEDYLFAKNKGAIGWLAGTTFGYIGELYMYAITFHKALTNSPSASFAQNIANSIDQYQLPTNNYNRAQCRQMIYMGDPSIKLFEANAPDYAVNPTKTFIYPENSTADADSFGIKIYLQNLGAASGDSFTIKVSQTLPGGSVFSHPAILHVPIHNNDSFLYWIKIPKGQNIKGLNTLTIQVDSANKVIEQSPLGESNNITSIQHYFSTTNAQILYPAKNGIINSTVVELAAQSLIFNPSNFNFLFELDTVPTFNSPYKQSSGTVSASYIAKASFTLLPNDSLDYYWRVKTDDGSGAGIWDISTFSMIKSSPEGWSQGYFQKFLESEKKQLVYDTLRQLQFTTTQSLPYVIETSGRTSSANWRTIWHEGYPLYFNYLTSAGILVVAINPKNEQRFNLNTKHNVVSSKSPWWQAPTNYLRPYFENPGVSKSCAYYYNMFNRADRDSFLFFLDRVPKDFTLMLMTGPTHNIPNWGDTIYTKLMEFGAIQTKTVKEQEPYILVGKKGQPSGTAIEKLADPTNPLPGKDQYIFVNTTLNILVDSGTMSSSVIGPSKSWKNFYRTLKPSDTLADNVKFNIYGIDPNGTKESLFRGITNRETDLSSIDALNFPYLQIEADIEDSINKTPTGIARWTIIYEGFPEGAINPKVSFFQNKDTLQEGDSLKFKIAFSNISSFNMDSLLVLITSTDELNSIDTLEFAKIASLNALQDLIIDRTFDTKGLIGAYKLNVFVNPNMAQPEQYLFNNSWQFKYFITTDKIKPFLDVVFDGRHITNLEIISPNPVITISAADENKYLLLNDASYFKVKIKYPGSSTFVNLDVYSDTFSFVPSKGPNDKSKLIYSPVNLKDGIYELAVSVIDASGNLASVEDYTISFKVITKSTITNVYPYPNPFTTKTRFVFTLTGEKLPDYLKITILNISGTIVKEITLDEIGTLNIGNNITSYEWNGTDMYGDKLANGVYLYKVKAMIKGKEVEMSESAGDTYFNKGYGKLYIMR